MAREFASSKKQPAKLAVFSTRDTDDKGVFFRDGKRRIDFVLAFDIPTEITEESISAEKARQSFHENLIRENLHLEIEMCPDASGETRVGFVKVHATWNALSKYAEVLRIRMPIEYFGETSQFSNAEGSKDDCCLNSCFKCMDYDREVIPDSPDYFSAPFSRPYVSLFRIKDEENFFTDAQRSRIAWYILSDAAFGPSHLEFGIHRLLSQSVYSAAYPLHDGEATSFNFKQQSLPIGALAAASAKPRPHDRYLLYRTWASFTQIIKHQPLDAVRDYFGEKIGIYFAWLGDYTKMLACLAFVGLAVCIYGAVTAHNDMSLEYVCSTTMLGCVIMCPLCNDGCGYWILRNSCITTVLAHLCDNMSTIGYAVVITVWGTLFVELWKRREMVLKYEWDIYDYEDREPPRPEFEAKASRTRLDPLTQQPEPYEPILLRIIRGLASWTVIAVIVLVILGTMISIIIYRTALNAKIYSSAVSEDSEFLENNGRLLISLSAALINLVVILILTAIYEWLALRLTEWELPRTQSDFDDSFTIKMFIFQFANCYGTIFYTAFLRGRFQSKVSKDFMSPAVRSFMDYMTEECDPAGCMADLTIQLAIVMVGRQIVSHIFELALPFLLKRRHKLRGWFSHKNVHQKQLLFADDANKKTSNKLSTVSPTTASSNCSGVTRWEADYNLVDFTQSGVVHEYLEMAIQFGFVTLFGVCFPLSPIFALLNNILEIRLDAYKLITSYRRPVAVMADGVGIWLDIFRCLIWMSVLSNALIIAFTSENVHRIAYEWLFESSGKVLIPPSMNGSSYQTTYFSYAMSVLSTNATSAKYKLDSQCLNMEYADPSSLGGFELQKISEVKNGLLNYCYYRGLSEPPWAQNPSEFKITHWELLVIRLAFALSFIVAVWFLSWLLSHAIPHRPEKVRLLQRHEQWLHERALLQANEVEEARSVKKTKSISSSFDL